MTHYLRRVWSIRVAFILMLTLVQAGCGPGKRHYNFVNPYPGTRSLAVVPFLNQSGSGAVDTIAVTDEFYTQLQQIDGFEVMPVNRVLSTFLRQGINNISNPGDALALADLLKVDAVIVGSITRYDPYFPPCIGMAIQVYARDRKGADAPRIDPAKLSLAARPFELESNSQMWPRAMVVRIFDANLKKTQKRIKKYEKLHGEEENPLSWKKYTTSRKYLSFVSHEIIGELLAQERDRLRSSKQGD